MFGENLKKLRKVRNLTQSQLGDKVGVTGAYIQQLEKGIKSNPSSDLLTKLCISLGVSMNDLIENDENMKASVINQAALSSSYLFPYNGDENSWVMQNLTPEQKEEYIKNSETYYKNKDKMMYEERKVDLLAAYVEIIAWDFIEVDKDKIEELSTQVASFINEYVEALVKAKIKGMIAKDTLNAQK